MMAQQSALSIIDELETAVRGSSSSRRVETLRQVTDLFLHDGGRLSDDQVEVFDNVLCLLIARVETCAKAELSKRLAPVDYAPFAVIQHLARDAEIAVAGPVLAHSGRLTPETLVEIAGTGGQDHLLAISGRANLPPSVTDVIVDRGDDSTLRRLAGNASARFSEAGYCDIVARAGGDDELAEVLGLRFDLPVKLLGDLLRRAKASVRARLLAIAPAGVQAEVRRVLDEIDRENAAPGRNFSSAEARVKLMKDAGKLDDVAVFRFAETGKFDELAASLAALNDVPTELTARLLEGPRSDLILIPCKSAGLTWITTETILSHRPAPKPIDAPTLAQAEKDYKKLTRDTAQRTVRFWQLHNRIEK